MLETLDSLGQRYGQRPAAFVPGMLDEPLEAVRFDEACALAGILAEQRLRQQPQARGRPAQEGATVNLRTGRIKGRVPIVRPPPELEAELDRLFPPTWFTDAPLIA